MEGEARVCREHMCTDLKWPGLPQAVCTFYSCTDGTRNSTEHTVLDLPDQTAIFWEMSHDKFRRRSLAFLVLLTIIMKRNNTIKENKNNDKQQELINNNNNNIEKQKSIVYPLINLILNSVFLIIYVIIVLRCAT